MTWWEGLGEAVRVQLVMSAVGGILSLLLFLLKPIIRNKLPKYAQYYLWIVAVLAFLAPVPAVVTLPGNAGIPSLSEAVRERVVSGYEYYEREIKRRTGQDAQLTMTQLRQLSADGLAEIIKAQTDTRRTADILNFLVFQLPVLGFISVINVNLTGYFRFMSRLKKRNAAAADGETALLRELCGERGAPGLYRNPIASTPMLAGLLRPAIILPDRAYTPEQLRAILLHELTHLRRGDVFIKWLALTAAAVHWFNPAVWLARRELDRVCELSCDEAVVRGLDAAGKQNYGNTLICAAGDAKPPKAVLSTTMCEEKKALKERLGAIMKSKSPGRAAAAVSAVLIAAAVGAALVLGAGSGGVVHNFSAMAVNGTVIDGTLSSALTVSVYDGGIRTLDIFRAHGEADDGSIVKSARDVRSIQDIEELLGEGRKKWHDYGQRLREAKYTGVNGLTAVFVYTNGDGDGIFNRLVRLDITPPAAKAPSPGTLPGSENGSG